MYHSLNIYGHFMAPHNMKRGATLKIKLMHYLSWYTSVMGYRQARWLRWYGLWKLPE